MDDPENWHEIASATERGEAVHGDGWESENSMEADFDVEEFSKPTSSLPLCTKEPGCGVNRLCGPCKQNSAKQCSNKIDGNPCNVCIVCVAKERRARVLANVIHANGKKEPPPGPAPKPAPKPRGKKAGKPVVEYLTDLGNGRRFARVHGKDLRYCHLWRKWFAWDGRRWPIDNVGRVPSLAKLVTVELLENAKHELQEIEKAAKENPDDTRLGIRAGFVKKLIAWAIKTQQAARLAAMIRLAESESGIPIKPEDFDRDPWALNCLNGTLDLRTGKLRPHERADYLTKLCPVEYHPDATCPLWERSLSRILDGKSNLLDYVQRAVGYSLTGNVSEHVLFFLYGTGANGKSTFLLTLLWLLGDYGLQAVSELLLSKTNESHPTERADLAGKRLAATIETDEGKKLAEALTKQLTGGDKVRARRMKEDFWEFEPQHKIWLAANHKPVIRGTDCAIWRRIKLIPFTVTIPENERDKDLVQKLRAEGPGILAWAVRGCLEWQKSGLGEPEEVKRATAEYRTQQDLTGTFLAECCLTGPDYRCRAKDLYDAFRQWCKSSGERELSQRRFGEALREKGFEDFTSNGTWYRGIAVKEP
jgi:putative DNA primase/helicase